ncbi:BTAD domain-containing putative transcriptional regulator, partial [Gordonia rhizosphera]|uniref:BTAD domain-containing putative transcriptional regulator n=1 Tax=Gordonia rhizosphera TaxID=83341 RepID=UPI00058D17C3
MVSLLLLGPVDVPGRTGGDLGQFGSPRLRCLLAALASRANTVADVDWLADILWPDHPPAAPDAALQNLIFRLRGQLRDRGVSDALRVVTAAPGYSLVVDRSDVDSLLFMDRCHNAEALVATDPAAAVETVDAAESLWQGRAYGEFSDQPWVRSEVEALGQMRVHTAEVAAEAQLRTGHAAEAATRLAAIADEHPYRESLHLLLMQALWRADRAADALEVYRTLRQRLSVDLGTEPAQRVQDLHTRILSGAPSRSVAQATPAGAEEVTGSIIGRTDDLAELEQRLGDSGMVTVVGPGGVGKTALVRRFVRDRDNVWFTELSAVSTPDAVVHSVVSATGVTVRRDLDVLDALTESLVPRTGLLVLDNCEHVADTAAELARTVRGRCRGVTILATSRVALGIDGEQVSVLEPLDTPSPGASASSIAESPSVQLFCARAHARDRRFALTDENASAVAEICRRLDGLPLGLELAATKARAIPPEVLVQRLQWRFRILRGARATAPRHRSLHALVDWSYGLLSEASRRLFDTLAVFPSRFDLDDAEELAESTGALARPDVADAVAELVDTSMLAVESGGYHMLETLRAFGIRQLEDSEHLEAVRAAHAAWVADWLAPLGRDLFGPGHVAAAARVTTRLDDIRAAIECVTDRDPQVASRLLEGVIPYLELSMSTEVTGWARRVIARLPSPDEHGDGAAAWAVAAGGARFDGDLSAAERYARTGLASQPAPAVEAYLLMMLEEVALFQGDADTALLRAHAVQDTAVAAQMAGVAHMAAATTVLIRVYQGQASGDGGCSGDHCTVAIELAATCDSSGEDVVAAWCRYVAGECILDSDPVRAATLLDSSIAEAKRNGDRYLLGVAMVSRASIEARHGSPEMAAELFVDVVGHWRDAGNWTHQWVSLRTVVDILARLDRFEPAALLLD